MLLLWLTLTVCSNTVMAKEINCPAGLKWSTEGYCKRDIDPRPRQPQEACPAQSHLAKPSVLGPIICQAKGSCESGYTMDTKQGQCR